MRQTATLTEGTIGKVLFRFSMPFLLANLLQALYGAVDLMIVAKYCDPDSIAAVSTGTQITQIITSVIAGLTMAGTILVAKYVGKGQMDKVQKTIQTTLLSFAVFSVLLMVVVMASASFLLHILQIPESAFTEAREYILLCCTGIFFICEYNALSAVLRGYGDSLRPLYFVAIACVCNIIGDIYTVGYLHMGASGTALATVVSQCVSMVVALFYINRNKGLFPFSLKKLHIDRTILKELITVGIPVSFQETMVRCSFLYLTAITNSFGIYAASAVGIAGKYDVFAMLPATSIANALTALTAQNIAYGKAKRAREFLRYGTITALLCSTVFFLWAQLSPQSMIRMFSIDAQVIQEGIPFLRACSFDYLAVSILFCMNGYLNGKERTIFTMLNCCSGALLIRVPLLYVLSSYGFVSMYIYGLVSPISSLFMLGVLWFYSRQLHPIRTLLALFPLQRFHRF